MTTAITAFIEALKTLSDAFTGLLVWVFGLFGINLNIQIVRLATIVLLVITVLRLSKHLPKIVILCVLLIICLQIIGFVFF